MGDMVTEEGHSHDIRQWSLGRSVTVVVPSEQVAEFVQILAEGVHWSLCDVVSDNGITINFSPEKDWSFEPETGEAWIQLRFDRREDPCDCHVLARHITRAQAREVAAGLTGTAPAIRPLMLNYLDDGVEGIGQVPVYFTAPSRPETVRGIERTHVEASAQEPSDDPSVR